MVLSGQVGVDWMWFCLVRLVGIYVVLFGQVVVDRVWFVGV